jgi:hypothetical protein
LYDLFADRLIRSFERCLFCLEVLIVVVVYSVGLFFSSRHSSEHLTYYPSSVSSESEFTFDKIAVEFLKHYIEHSDASFNAE